MLMMAMIWNEIIGCSIIKLKLLLSYLTLFCILLISEQVILLSQFRGRWMILCWLMQERKWRILEFRCKWLLLLSLLLLEMAPVKLVSDASVVDGFCCIWWSGFGDDGISVGWRCVGKFLVMFLLNFSGFVSVLFTDCWLVRMPGWF